MERRIEDDEQSLRLMLAHIPNNHINHTKKRSPLGLSELGLRLISSTNNNLMELHLDMAAPSPDWEKFLNLQTGLFYFVNRGTGATRQLEVKINSSGFELINNPRSDNDGNGNVDRLSLDLGLRLWGNTNPDDVIALPHATLDQSSPPHSALSFQGDSDEHLLSPCCSNNNNNDYINDSNNDNIDGSKLVTYGCSKCLMFLMMPEDDPHCPRCGTSSALLNIVSPTPASL